MRPDENAKHVNNYIITVIQDIIQNVTVINEILIQRDLRMVTTATSLKTENK